MFSSPYPFTAYTITPSTETPSAFLHALPSYLPHSSFPAEISSFPLPHWPLTNAPAISLPSYGPPHPAPYHISSSLHPHTSHSSPLLSPTSPIRPAPSPSTLHPLNPITTLPSSPVQLHPFHQMHHCPSPMPPGRRLPHPSLYLFPGLFRRLHLSRSATSRTLEWL